MRWKRTIQLLDVHAEGEIGRVAIGGVPKIPGDTIAAQLHWLNTDPKGDELRRFLCLEPRGAPIGSVNLLLPAKHPDADAGFIILQPDQAHASSGSNSICVTTALLESGIVEMREPETVVTLDTAAGLVREEEMLNLFPDCELGAEPPFGKLYDLPVYVASQFEEDQSITFNAGTHDTAIRMPFYEFACLVEPQVVDCARKPHADDAW